MKNFYLFNVTNQVEELAYYVFAASINFNQDIVNRPLGYKRYQLNICKEGKGVLLINGLEIPVNKGDSIIIYPNIPYKYIPVGNNMIVSWVAFDGFQVNSMLKFIGITNSGVYKFFNPKNIHSLIIDIVRLQNEDITNQVYSGSRLIYNFLLTLKRNSMFHNDTVNEFSIDKIKPSIDFMNTHLGEQIGIEDIANSMNITPQHYCQIFKTIMKQRPFEYLNALRINHAKNLLIDRLEYPVKDIARLSGYPNQSYFCQLFKKSERLTPGKFRELYR
jgi:AraC-like DNA-binding protein